MDIEESKTERMVGLRAFLLGTVLSGVFAWVTVMRDNFPPTVYLSANLIPVLPHVFLVLAGVVINPILRRLRFIRLFSKSEMLLIFVMCAVSSGLATFGFVGKLVPTVAGLSNPAWNTDQRQWDIHVMPFLNEHYFIVEQGARGKAKALREAHLAYELARKQYRVARDLKVGRSELARVKADVKVAEATPDPEKRKARLNALKWPQSQAEELLGRVSEEWDACGGELDVETVAATFEKKVDALKEKRDTLREELKTYNQKATDAATLVRKGLPREKRALPGFFYATGEGWAGYSARYQRMKVGSRSLEMLNALQAELDAAIENKRVLPDAWAEQVTAAAKMLEAVSDIPKLAALNDKLTIKVDGLETELEARKVEVRRLKHLRRYSNQNQFEEFEEKIDAGEARIEELEEAASGPRDRLKNQIRPQLDVCERVKQTNVALLQLAAGVAQTPADAYPALKASLAALAASYNAFDGTVRRYWLGDIRWGLWVGPVFNWVLLMFVAYLVIISFNVLIYRQWSHHEKLIYPLAEFGVLLAGGGEAKGRQKPLYRSALFWLGFCVAAGILGWNKLATEQIIPNINPIKLQTMWYGYMGNGPLRGLQATWFCVIFAVIGISFLVPASISYSLWFFELCYMGLVLLMVWMGYGNNRQDLQTPSRGMLGAGAVLVFGSLILWTCRNYLLCAFKPKALKGMAPGDQRELRVSSFTFLGSTLLLVLILSLGLGANLLYTVVYLFVVLIIMIAIMRAVAEGGVLGMEGRISAFGMMGTTLGTAKAWYAPVLLAPIAVFSGFLFGSLKAMIAPMMANALKVRERMHVKRWVFHTAIWTGIVVTVLVSVVTLIMMSYEHGADNLGDWLNTGSARATLDSVKGMATGSDAQNPSAPIWMLAGALVMGGLLLARRRIFGIPHPIGLLMMMNPVMYGLWASILIGWGFKSVVSKYCSNEQYIVIRRFFIGLIFGHLFAVFLGWEALEFHFG